MAHIDLPETCSRSVFRFLVSTSCTCCQLGSILLPSCATSDAHRTLWDWVPPSPPWKQVK